MRKILVVDDDPQMRFFLTQALRREEYEIDVAEDGASAIERAREQTYDLALMDVKLPDMNGLDVMREVRKIQPDLVVVVITAHGTRDTALEAVRRGAYDYFTKPLKVEELRVVIRRALERVTLNGQIEELKRQLHDREQFSLIVGQSERMLEMIRNLEKLCRVDTTVLILGESGTGKELIAQAVHGNSSRKDRPFVQVNCAAIPPQLLESELFGHKKGSFTDAKADREGKFQAANGGTLILDEIGDMDQNLQAKILRALENRIIEPVGSNTAVSVDLRVIASTNRDLSQMVRDGAFREDLFYRLAVFTVTVPPLRDRDGDVPLLARHFVRMYSEWLDKPITGITDAAMAALSAYDWPGNVRELKNCIEFAAVMTERDVIDLPDLPPQVVRKAGQAAEAVSPDGRIPLDETVARMEKQIIIDTLRKTGVVQSRAAEILGITERSMWHRVKKYSIDIDALRAELKA